MMSISIKGTTPSDNPIAVRTPGGNPDKKQKLKVKAKDYQKNYKAGQKGQTDAEKTAKKLGLNLTVKDKDKVSLDRSDKLTKKVVKNLGDDITAQLIKPNHSESRKSHTDLSYFDEIESTEFRGNTPENVLDVTVHPPSIIKKKKEDEEEED